MYVHTEKGRGRCRSFKTMGKILNEILILKQIVEAGRWAAICIQSFICVQLAHTRIHISFSQLYVFINHLLLYVIVILAGNLMLNSEEHTPQPLSLLRLTLSLSLSHTRAAVIIVKPDVCSLETKPKNDKAATGEKCICVCVCEWVQCTYRHRLNCGSFNISGGREKRWHLKPEISQFAPWETMQLSLAAVARSLFSLSLFTRARSCLLCEMREETIRGKETESERILRYCKGKVNIFFCSFSFQVQILYEFQICVIYYFIIKL